MWEPANIQQFSEDFIRHKPKNVESQSEITADSDCISKVSAFGSYIKYGDLY